MRLTSRLATVGESGYNDLTFRFPGGESDQAFRLCPQMKYAIGRTPAELASAAAAVVTWLGVEHINRLGGQPL